MCMCQKCSKITGIMLLVIGLLFLMRDLNIWDFWGISWWTALILVGGVAAFASSHCPDCQGSSKKKK